MITTKRNDKAGKRNGILLVVRELGAGGIERDVAKLAISLMGSGWVPHVACYQGAGMRLDELRHADVPVLHLPMGSIFSRQAIRAGMILRKYIKHNGIVIVHAWDPSAVLAVPVARLCRVPVVMSSQLGSRSLMDRTTLKLMRWTDKMVDAIVVNCEALQRHLESDEGIRSGLIRLCYNGVDLTKFNGAVGCATGDSGGAEATIGTVCVLRPEKGLELLLRAFSRVVKNGCSARLVIVGDGSEGLRLRSLADELGLGDRCAFVGAQVDVEVWLRRMDVFVLPSYSEAFSNSLLEAMASNCAVIGSSVGGTPEIIGDSGLLFPSGDHEVLAQRLEEVLNSQSRRIELGAAARRRVGQWSMERHTERMSEIYMELLGGAS